MSEVTNIAKIDIDEIRVNTIISKSIILYIDGIAISDVLMSLYNRYYFNESLALLTGNKSVKYRIVNDVPISLDKKYYLCIDVHDKILLIDETTFATYSKNPLVEIDTLDIFTTNVITEDITDILDDAAAVSPVTYYINTKSDSKQFIEIYHDLIYINIHNKRYEIFREVFDMLYVECEDFIPTSDLHSGIVVKTQARHQLFNDGYFSSDLLHSDIGLICDIQDKLITEYNKLHQEVNEN